MSGSSPFAPSVAVPSAAPPHQFIEDASALEVSHESTRNATLLLVQSLCANPDGDIDIALFRKARLARRERTDRLLQQMALLNADINNLCTELHILEEEERERGGHKWRIRHGQRRDGPGEYVSWARSLDEDVFREEFGVSHAIVHNIVNRVRNSPQFQTMTRPHAVEHILLCCLLRGRTGQGIRHLRTNCSVSAGAVSQEMRMMHKIVVRAFWDERVTSLRPDTPEKRRQASAAFEKLQGIPGCIGLCDGTGCPIPFPPVPDQAARESYRYYKTSKVSLDSRH